MNEQSVVPHWEPSKKQACRRISFESWHYQHQQLHTSPIRYTRPASFSWWTSLPKILFKHKTVQTNTYLFEHGPTVCKFSGKSPLWSHKTTLKQQVNGQKTMKNERKRLILFWFSFYSLFASGHPVSDYLFILNLFLVELCCFPVQCLEDCWNLLWTWAQLDS